MQEKYGHQLQIAGIDTSRQLGSDLYDEAVEVFSIPSSRLGVPTRIVSDTVLVGSVEIPDQFLA